MARRQAATHLQALVQREPHCVRQPQPLLRETPQRLRARLAYQEVARKQRRARVGRLRRDQRRARLDLHGRRVRACVLAWRLRGRAALGEAPPTRKSSLAAQRHACLHTSCRAAAEQRPRAHLLLPPPQGRQLALHKRSRPRQLGVARRDLARVARLQRAALLQQRRQLEAGAGRGAGVVGKGSARRAPWRSVEPLLGTLAATRALQRRSLQSLARGNQAATPCRVLHNRAMATSHLLLQLGGGRAGATPEPRRAVAAWQRCRGATRRLKDSRAKCGARACVVQLPRTGAAAFKASVGPRCCCCAQHGRAGWRSAPG